jgi:enoyl-CoA hydratase
MREQYETVALKQPAPDVLQITLSRPAFANAMNTQMGLDLLDIFTELFAKPESYRAVVVTGRANAPSVPGATLRNVRA